jgi:Cu/Ag efflux pump CusA
MLSPRTSSRDLLQISRRRCATGRILVVIVVVLFLMNVRAALITLLAIPISVITAVTTMNWFG